MALLTYPGSVRDTYLLHSFKAVTCPNNLRGKWLQFYHNLGEQGHVNVTSKPSLIFIPKSDSLWPTPFPSYWLGWNDSLRLSMKYDGQQLPWYPSPFPHLVQ